MKRITILFDDERLYRDLKAEAAKEGRSVKVVVAEALGSWLQGRAGLTESQRERRAAALRQTDAIRSGQQERNIIEQLLAEIRDVEN